MSNNEQIQNTFAQVFEYAAAKKDYVVPSEFLHVTPTGMLQILEPGKEVIGPFEMNPKLQGQLCSWLEIPKKWHDRMRADHLDLISLVATCLFERKAEPRMIRTLHGRARALLSNTYDTLRFENETMAIAFLEGLDMASKDGVNLNITDVSLTDDTFKIDVNFPDMVERVEGSARGMGDLVSAGLSGQNCETGGGCFSAKYRMLALICLNGMMSTKLVNGVHRTSKNAYDVNTSFEVEYAADTVEVTQKAMVLQVRDAVRTATKAETLQKVVATFNRAAARKIDTTVAKLDKVVELATRTVSSKFTEDERNTVLNNLIGGGDLSQWGVINAVTAMAKEADTERGIQIEESGMALASIPVTTWDAIAVAV